MYVYIKRFSLEFLKSQNDSNLQQTTKMTTTKSCIIHARPEVCSFHKIKLQWFTRKNVNKKKEAVTMLGQGDCSCTDSRQRFSYDTHQIKDSFSPIFTKEQVQY